VTAVNPEQDEMRRLLRDKVVSEMYPQACEEIKRLERERDSLADRLRDAEEALEPFVRATDFYTGDTDNEYSLRVRGADIRRARAALRDAGGEQ
jgi:hypothetical protein